jgi:hypothetical protein
MNIVSDIINRQLNASSSPGTEAAQRLINLAAQMERMPNTARMLKRLGLAEEAVAGAQQGKVFDLSDLDQKLQAAGIKGSSSIEFKLDLASCGLLARKG